MPRWLLVAVFLVAGSGVLFGLNWRPVPEPRYEPATHVAVSAAPPPISRTVAADEGLSPIVTAAPIATAAEPIKTVSGAQPIPPAAEFVPNSAPIAPSSTNASAPAPERKAQALACNVDACQQAYFTFNPADCTYQPSNGPRRLCAK